MPAKPANSMNQQAAQGIVTWDGTSVESTQALTQYNVLTGSANANAFNQVAPSTAGQLFTSAGASAQPTWTTSTYPGTNAANTLLYASSANTMAALTTADNGVLITSATGVPSWLADGTTGQTLTATTSGPPTWVNKGWTKIITVSASTSASLTITSGIITQYTNYAIVFDNVTVSSNGLILLQVSSNGGSSYASSGYLSGANNFSYSSTTVANSNSTAGLILGQTNTVYYTSGCIYLTSMTNGQYPAASGTATTFDPGTNTIMYLVCGGYGTQITVDAIKILNSAGNLVTGDFTLYGLMF